MTRAGFEYVLDKHVALQPRDLRVVARPLSLSAPASA